MLLQFKEEIVRPENLVVPFQPFTGFLRALSGNDAWNFGRHAA